MATQGLRLKVDRRLHIAPKSAFVAVDGHSIGGFCVLRDVKAYVRLIRFVEVFVTSSATQVRLPL